MSTASVESAGARRYEGRVAWVTGGAGAIGGATAARLGAEGAHVFLVDRNPAALSDAVVGLRDAGVSAAGCVADVTEEPAVQRAVDEAVETFGRIDVAALVAGMAAPRRVLWEMPVQDWDRVIATNLRSTFLTLRAVLATMVAGGVAGSVVTMSSTHALWDVHDGGAAYSASKGGVLSLTRVAAFDAARHRIRVNSIAAGVVQTSLGLPDPVPGLVMLPPEQRAARIPLGRIGQVDDIAALTAFLGSDEAGHITGSTMLIDGGQTLQSWANSPAEG